MPSATLIHQTGTQPQQGAEHPGEPCLLVLFGASGDLTKRLLMPALYNLACDGLLPQQFALIGLAKDELSTEEFRARMSADIKQFTTRATFDQRVWDEFVRRLHYTPGDELVPDALVERRAGGELL